MPTFFVILAAILWGLIGPVSRFAFHHGISALEVAFWRAAVAAAFFLTQAAISRHGVRVSRADVPGVIAFGIVGVALLEGSNILAFSKGGAAFGALMLYSAPAWVGLGSWLFLKEKLPFAKVVAVGLTVMGVAGVALSGNDGIGTAGRGFGLDAVAWGMVSGLSYAAFYFFGAHYFRKYSPWTVMANSFPVGVVALLPFVEFRPKSPEAWIPLLFLGFASTYLAYFFYSLGLRRMSATRAAVIASVEPLVAAAGGWIVWGERLSVWGYFWGAWLIGGVFIVASIPEPEAGKPS